MTLLVTFHSVGSALYTRMLLAERGAAGTVVPVPRSVSSSCGYALETADMPPPALAAAMDKAGIEWDAIYRPAGNAGADVYERISGNEGTKR